MTIVFFEAAYYACWAWHGGNISFKFERVVGKTTGYICCKTLVWVSAQSGSLKTLVTFLSLTYKEINISGYPCICLSILWILTCIGFPGIVAFDCVSFCEMSVFGSVWMCLGSFFQLAPEIRGNLAQERDEEGNQTIVGKLLLGGKKSRRIATMSFNCSFPPLYDDVWLF